MTIFTPEMVHYLETHCDVHVSFVNGREEWNAKLTDEQFAALKEMDRRGKAQRAEERRAAKVKRTQKQSGNIIDATKRFSA